MALSSLWRTDVICVAPNTFLRVVAAVLPEGGAPTDLQLLLQPLEGGCAQKLSLAAFNQQYPEAKLEYAGQTVAYQEIKVHGIYRSASGLVCRVLEFTVDPQDCIALVRFRQKDGVEEIISTEEFRELFPNEVLNTVH